MSLLNLTDVKDLQTRAFHTFYQAFIVVFGAGLLNVLSDFHKGVGAGRSALLALVLSAVAAGISALKTALVQNNTKG